MEIRGFPNARTLVILGLAGLLSMLPGIAVRAQQSPSGLKLQISSEQPFVVEPQAARIVMQIHNSSSQAVWLYRRARAKRPPVDQPSDESRPTPTTGSSTVEVHLQPTDAQAAKSAASPAEATVLEYVLMPKPRLVKLEAGADYREVSIVHLSPAMAAAQKPIWGAYRLTVTYGASFSNGDQLQRNLGVILWQEEVTSNSMNVELRPPLAGSTGAVSGTTVNKELRALAGIRVSLQDEQGQLIDQQVTAGDGRFSFAPLPLTLYWITGRQEEATQDTVTFRHEELSSAASSVTDQLVFYPQEVYEAKKLVHKPVLLRVFDAGHTPQGGIGIDAIYSNGEVIDDVKATTDGDGTAAMELLPGRNTITLSKHGCQDQTERLDLAPGTGADGSRFVFSCERK